MPAAPQLDSTTHLLTGLACSAIVSANRVEGFEKGVTLDGDPRAAIVWPEPLQRDELTRKQRLDVRAFQF